MKKKFLLVITSILMLMLICQIVYAGLSTKLYEKITVTTGAAIGFTNVPSRCSEVLVICETNDVRFRTDGTDPTSTTGMVLEAGQNILLTGWTNISRFKAIAVSATGYLSVEYRVGY
jgi:hypothetical protein